jgi:uncharacterized membrane protein
MQTPSPARKKSMIWVIFAVGAALSWGLYGPILAKGQVGLGSPMKAMLCVGGAYFLMGILVPLFALGPSGMTGFNQTGIINATIGGALGALGAIFIIYAFKNGGVPTYVMPLVFGGAPLINTLYSMWLNPPKESISPVMWLGMIMVPVGAALVLLYRPAH